MRLSRPGHIYERLERKWTWQSLSGIKNEIDFTITNMRGIVKQVEGMNKVNIGSNHRMVKSKLKLHLRGKRKPLI